MSHKDVSYEDKFCNNGFLEKRWRNDTGEMHREDGPAFIRCYPNGHTIVQSYVQNDVYHREDGPAYIEYSSEGSLDTEEFWICGKYLGKDKFGFWSLWEMLTDEQRRSPNILKYLVIYS